MQDHMHLHFVHLLETEEAEVEQSVAHRHCWPFLDIFYHIYSKINTYGALAKGIPKKRVRFPVEVPWKVP